MGLANRHLLSGDEARRVPKELGLRGDGDLAQDAVVLVALLEPEQPVGLQQDGRVRVMVRVRVRVRIKIRVRARVRMA